MSLPYEGDSEIDPKVPGITGTNSVGGTGVLGTSAGGVAVWGKNTGSPPGPAGVFEGVVGIGTTNPLFNLHAVGQGNFGGENPDGTAQQGGVPLVAQGNGTVFGIINANGRPAFALNIEGNNAENAERGVPTFYDKYDGNWHSSLSLKNGNVGIGTTGPQGRLDVAGFVRLGFDEGGSGPRALSFSRDPNDEGNAGQIAYKPPDWDNTALCIVGAGAAFPRKTRIFDDLVVDRNVGIGGDLSVGGNISINGADLASRLNKSLAADGTLVPGSVGGSQLANGAVPISKLNAALVCNQQVLLPADAQAVVTVFSSDTPAFLLIAVHVDDRNPGGWVPSSPLTGVIVS